MAGAAEGQVLPLSPGGGPSRPKDSAFSRMLAAGLRSNVVATMGKFALVLSHNFHAAVWQVCTALLKGYCRGPGLPGFCLLRLSKTGRSGDVRKAQSARLRASSCENVRDKGAAN